ncbi:hypothetical protein, partial [Flavonifractor plautii]|uniref:hypothetical protein n=1 Tax=Flavonifractor plautii TaxID=292800 RepID=UPI003D7CF2EC
TNFLNLVTSGAEFGTQANELRDEFTKIRDAAIFYKENPGNARNRDQIIYWLNNAIDQGNAALKIIDGLEAIKTNPDKVWDHYSAALDLYNQSKT